MLTKEKEDLIRKLLSEKGRTYREITKIVHCSPNDITRTHRKPTGLKCPFNVHIRRLKPRDALKNNLVVVYLHHVLRRGTNYGPPLPEGGT